MTAKDHGIWKRYIPAPWPEGMPKNALFLKRESDGLDWYEYVNVEAGNPAHEGRTQQFKTSSVKLVIEPHAVDKDGAPVTIIRSGAVDATRLFPEGCQLIELLDVERDQDEAKLIEEFVWRMIDTNTGKLGPKWEPPVPEAKMDDRVADALEAILERLEKLEGKRG